MIVNSLLFVFFIVGFALDYHRVLQYDPRYLSALQIVHEYKTNLKNQVTKDEMNSSTSQLASSFKAMDISAVGPELDA